MTQLEFQFMYDPTIFSLKRHPRTKAGLPSTLVDQPKYGTWEHCKTYNHALPDPCTHCGR